MWYNIVAETKEGKKMQRENSHNSSLHLSKYADYRRRRDSAVDGSIALVKMILDDRASKGQSLDYGDIYSEAYRWYRGLRYEDVKSIFNENSRRNLVNLFTRGMRIFLFLTSR